MSSSPAAAPAAPASSIAEGGGLSAAEVAAFRREGYLVLPEYYSAATLATLSAAAAELVSGWSAGGAAAGVFTTDEQARQSDAYFLGSGDKVRPFLEAAAAREAPTLANINKIGHALHELCPPFAAATMTAACAGICRSLGYAAPAVAQSMFILKPARVGGAVAPHVDGAFLRTTPASVLGFWVPLERCHTGNGCLWVVPRSHGAGVRRIFRRNAAGTGTEFSPAEPEAWDRAGAVPLEVPAGACVLLDAAVLHWSEANTSDESRHAYSWHVIETGRGVVYEKDNWLQREDGGPFPRLY